MAPARRFLSGLARDRRRRKSEAATFFFAGEDPEMERLTERESLTR
jgi:hypothetical protein